MNIVSCAEYNDLTKTCNRYYSADRSDHQCQSCPAQSDTDTSAVNTEIAPQIPLNNKQECENCNVVKTLYKRIEDLEEALDDERAKTAKLQAFVEMQKGKRQQSRKITRLKQNEELIRAMKASKLSLKTIGVAFGVSEISVRRLLSGELK